jgi:predicted ATPase
MLLAELKIENFRSFEEATIRFSDYTCFVGPNGSGKSTVLMALNILFRENAATVTDMCTLSEEDFHHKNTGKPVRITATFVDLPTPAQQEFKHYYRQGKLLIFAEAVWNEDSRSAPVKHYGSRQVMRDFAEFFAADNEGKKVAELKEIYAKIREGFPELPTASTKPAMSDALRAYEESHTEKCELIDESNQFYGFTRGTYHLENYIQWVYVPAVKDASTEQEEGSKTALGQLLARTVRTKLDFSEAIEGLKREVQTKYTDILSAQEEALKGLGLSMERRLQDYIDARARLDLKWYCDSKSSISIKDPVARAVIGDGDFVGEIARAGHGLQRGFLVTILHELVGNEAKGGPKLLLGFEEPELYQHPPQAQHLADVLERLALPENNSQIIVTTHSPYFVSSGGFPNIRMVRKERNFRVSAVRAGSVEALEQRLGRALQTTTASPASLMATIGQIMQPSQTELYFSSVGVLVEGQEDVAFVSSQLVLNRQLSEFRRMGCHFVVAGGKTNLSRLVAIAQELEIPFLLIFDADGNEIKEDKRRNQERDNLCLMRLCSVDGGQSFPPETLWGENFVVWPTKIRPVIRNDFGSTHWDAAQAAAREKHDLDQGVSPKNRLLVAYTLQELSEQGKQSPMLIKLCGNILRYAERIQVGARRNSQSPGAASIRDFGGQRSD